MMSNKSDASDDDIPQLSSETFAALEEFYKEQELIDKKLQQLSNLNTDNNKTINFEENWQISQFWYDDTTTNTLANIARKCVGEGGKIALISCPTLYKKIKQDCPEVKLFEFDERFAVYGNDFILYDYKSPLNIPRELVNYFDLIIADPPFLSEECLTKTAVTMQYLAKNKIILCTGSVMGELAERLLHVKKCKFEPRHEKNLANEFACFANFDMDSFL